MRKPIKIPSIEAPRFNDLASMQTSILQLKEAVELLSGQRGGGFFPTYEDATRVQEQIKNLQKNSKWDILYNQEFSVVSGFYVPNLIEYRNLRGQLYLYQSAGAANWPYARFLDINGNAVSGANAYLAEGIYNVENTVGTPTGWSNNALDKTTLPLALQNNLLSGNVFGCFNDFSVFCLNKTVQTTFMSRFQYYNGSNIVKGTVVARESGAAQRSGMLFGIAGGVGTITGHLILEGLKG